MVFVKRNANHQVCAIFEDNSPELERLDNAHDEVKDFLMRVNLIDLAGFMKSDLELIRVIEDIIKILMEKSIISVTDLPPAVIDKLVVRKQIRRTIQQS